MTNWTNKISPLLVGYFSKFYSYNNCLQTYFFEFVVCKHLEATSEYFVPFDPH